MYGDGIRKLRVGLGLTRMELSEKTGITYNCIQNMELGRRGTDIDILQKLAKVLVPTGTLSELIYTVEHPEIADFYKPSFRKVNVELEITVTLDCPDKEVNRVIKSISNVISRNKYVVGVSI